MHKLIRIYVWISLLLSPLLLKGQDVHFSQAVGVPVFLNPGFTGFFNGKYRVGTIYRNQWASITSPYQSYGLSAEAPLFKSRGTGNGLSAGISFIRDVAGTSRYGNFQGNILVAYSHTLNRQRTQFLSLGLQAGYGQFGFSTEKLSFGRESESKENFSSTHDQYPDISAGLAWQYQTEGELTWQAGIAAFHLTQPSLDYAVYNSSSRIPMRYIAHLNTSIRHWDDYSVIPSVMYQLQNNFQEIMYGGDFKWFINETPENYFTLSAGIYFRQADAIILGLKSEYKTWLFCLSYDTNISSLRKASHTIGGFELSVLYIYRKFKSKFKDIPCPVAF